MKKPFILSPAFQIRQCSRPECRFRFPVDLLVTTGEVCPRCHAPTGAVTEPHSGSQIELLPATPSGPEVEALLDNIRSTFNVGAMFRTADGAGIRRLHLCGITSRPDNPKVASRIAKTALGAEQTVLWQAHNNILDAAQDLKAGGMRLWALEGGPRAESLFSSAGDLPGAPILLVVGNELSGVDPEVLDLCERVVAIPMQGYKRSLNVAIAFGVAAYFLRYGMRVERGQ